MYNIVTNFFKTLVCIFFIMLVLCACAEFEVKKNVIAETTALYDINAAIPVISGLGNDEAETLINNEINSQCMDEIDNFKSIAADTLDNDPNGIDKKYTFDSDVIIYKSAKTVSIMREVNMYMGGPHDSSIRPCITIDTEKCEKTELSDLFIDDSWRDMLNRRMLEKIESEPDEYSDLWEKPVIMLDQQFYIDGVNLILYYPPYELSYYARGYVSFSIPLRSMSGYIKNEYIPE